MNGRALGWRQADASLPYARHWNPTLAPLPEAIRAALEAGPVAPPMIAALEDAPASLAGPSSTLTQGYTITADREVRVALQLFLPDVTPAMFDWWFGWHSDGPERYRLWHPQAHLHAEWLRAPPVGSTGRARYRGHTSVVDEYIGPTLLRGAIQFRDPAELGFTDPRLAEEDEATLVCARVGPADAPVDLGWLAHRVQRVEGGSLLDSRFWLGGRLIAPRSRGGWLAARLARLATRLGEAEARAILVHCAQEMQHLGSFLPALHAEEAGRP